MARKKEVNWAQHFDHIRSVCPWSHSAWQRGDILISDIDQGLRPLGQYQAIVYQSRLNPRQTKKLALKWSKLDLECEFLVSDSSYGPWGTPRPVIIQQHAEYLANLRHKLGSKNQDP